MTLEIWRLLITGVAAVVTAVISVYSWNRYRPLAVVVPIWFAAAWLLSQRGFFASPSGWSPGDLLGFSIFGALMSLPIVLFFVAQARSSRLRQFLVAIPLPLLLGVQLYRTAGAIFLWLLAAGLVPAALGRPTGFADIAVGLLALPIAWTVARGMRGSRPLAIAWNMFGMLDFATAVSVVSLSILGVTTLQPDPVLVGLHPLALISLFQLPLSICLHILALQRLRRPFPTTGHFSGRPQIS